MEEELEGAAAEPAPASGPAPADPGEEEVVEEVAAVFGVVEADEQLATAVEVTAQITSRVG